MKVLHVLSSNQRRGAEIHGFDLIPELNKLGLTQGVALIEPRLHEGLEYDAPTTELTTTRNGHPYHLHIIRALWKLLGATRPDVIQTHGGNALKYAAPLAASRKIPLVHRSIGMAARQATKGPRRLFYTWLMERAHRVISVSPAVQQEAVKVFGIDPERAVLMPNAIDPKRIRPTRGRLEIRDYLGIAPDAPLILSLAALTWDKDPIGHITVAAQVLEQEPRAIHLFAGDGPMRDEAEATIRRLGTADRQFLLGSRGDVNNLLHAADVFLFAGRNEVEGMPGVLIEAGMARLPVVGYEGPATTEVVVDQETGILVRYGDPRSLADGALRLLAEADVRRRMAASARARCSRLFSIGRMANEYAELYEHAS